VIAAALSLVGEGFFVHIWIPVRRNRSTDYKDESQFRRKLSLLKILKPLPEVR
jgi:hypothetical protein